MTRNSHFIGNVDVESSHCAQSLYRRMGFRRRQATTSKLEIPEGALKEITLLFHHDIASKGEKFSIRILLSLTWIKRLQITYMVGGRH